MSDKRLYLIDATAFCYRAFYALPKLSTSFGQQTGAIYGFINILSKILKSEKPDYLAVCFDVSRDTFRQKRFSEYKINRPPMPDMLSGQIPLIKEIIAKYGIPIFEKEGYEADDIIATITKMANTKGLSTTIVSSDKDILQLVDDKTRVFSPHKDEGVIYDSEKVLERFGVKPIKIADIIALMGDKVDNIPGVPGIGEKTAKELISKFGSLEQLLENIDEVKQEAVKQAILDNIDKVNLSKELAMLDKDVDIDLDLDKLKIGKPDFNELYRIFKHLEFKRLLKDFPVTEEEPKDATLIRLQDRELKNIVAGGLELILYGNNIDDLVFYASPVTNTTCKDGPSKICNGVKDKLFRLGSTGENLRTILREPEIKKISHDLKKTKVSLAKNNISLGGLYFDTMVAAYLLNPSRPGYLLADVAWEYLGERIGGILGNQRAISLIMRLKPRLEKDLREKELLRLFCDLEMPLVEVLAQMELNGIKLDLKLLDKLSHDIEKRLIKLIEDIYDLSGAQFNINSPKQLREILFVKLKLPVVKKSKTGPSTDEEVLRALADKHKLPALLVEYRQLVKLKNTYVDTLPNLIDRNTGRLHASFNQAATETGRLSSSNPNLQNIPVKTDIGKNIRRAIVSSGADSWLLSCDYSQIELRILAHLSKDEDLILAFKKDKDIHKITASLIYGLDEKDVSVVMRDIAKRVNFGIIYGLTSYGLSRDIGIAVSEAQNFIEAYFLRYPNVKEYIHEQIEKAQKFGFVTTILGRRRYLPEINNKNQAIRQFAERQAVNTPIQGSASDLIKLAMVQIHNEIRIKELSAKMILQVHDELVFDCRTEELKELTELVKNRMEKALELDVPVRVDIKKGRNWLEMDPVCREEK
jgi:DNA polymerase I